MSNFDIVATLRANVSNFTRGMKEAQSSVENMQKKTGSSFQKIGGIMKDAGKGMTIGLTLPLVGLATMAARTGAAFDDQMSTVAAVTRASAGEMETLRRAARDMGRDTRYSASEAAKAQENLARAGFDTNEILSALGPTLNLATAGALSLDDASSIAAGAIRGFGLEASDAERVADVLAFTAAATKTSVGGLGETFKYVAPIASMLGIEMEEVAAAAGIMGDANIDAGQAGNMLKRGLLNLSAPTKQQADLMNDLGMNMFDAEGNMKPLVDVIGELEKGLEGMDAKQRTAALSTLFGAQAVSGWTALVNEGSGSLQDLQNEIQGADGFAQEFSETAEDNLAGSMRNLNSSWEELMIAISDGVKGPLRGLVDMLSGVLDWLSSLDEGTQQTIIMVGGLVAALGPLLFIFGTIVQKIPAIITGFKFIGTAIAALFSPIGLIIAAIAAFVAILIYLWNTNEEFRAAVIDIWNGIKEGIQTAWEALSAYLQPAVQAVVDFVKDIFGGLVTWWQENNQMILQAAQNVWNFVSQVITVALGVIMAVMQKVWPFVEKLVVFTWNAIKDVIQGAIKVITGIIEFFSALFTGNWSALWESVKQIVTGAVQLIWGLIKLWFVTKIIALAKALLVSLKTIVTTIWTTIKSIFTGGLQFIFGKVSSVFSSISGIIKTVMGSIQGTISSILNAIKTVFSNILSSIVSSVTGGFSKVAGAFSKGMSSALRTVTGFVTKFFKAGANIVGNIAKGITSAVGKVTSAIGGVLGKARDLLPFSPPKDKSSPLVDIHKNGIIEQIAKGIYGEENQLKKAMNSVLGTAGNEVSDFNGNINDALRNSINGGYSMSASGELSVKQQPAYLNLNIGGQNFTAFVENISDAQNKKIRLESAFGL